MENKVLYKQLVIITNLKGEFMKLIKAILFIMLSLILLTGCKTKENESKEEAYISSDSVDQSTVTEEDDKIDLTLYLYGPDDYDNPIEKKVISVSKELYENNMAEALNDVFEETDIKINNAEVDKETQCITVDIPDEVAMKFNYGSCSGATLTNELVDTILNLPDIQSAIITVDGEKDSYADHYNFEGIFTKNEE